MERGKYMESAWKVIKCDVCDLALKVGDSRVSRYAIRALRSSLNFATQFSEVSVFVCFFLFSFSIYWVVKISLLFTYSPKVR